MITYLNIKRKLISTALTTTGSDFPTPLCHQLGCVDNWAKTVPNVLVMGLHEPPRTNGIRWFRTKEQPTVRNIMGTYMVQIPGTETCILAAPNVHIGGRQLDLLNYVNAQKMELAWGSFCKCKHDDAAPSLFVLSASVIAHMMNDIPPELTFNGNEWALWCDAWFKRLMQPNRYFDGTDYGIAIPMDVPAPVMNAYDLTPDPIPEPVTEVKEPKKKAKKSKK